MNKGGKVMTDGKRSEAGSGQGGEVVLITGASGFIAAALIAQLGERYTVVELGNQRRSEEHTAELQSLMRNSYAVLCLKKKKYKTKTKDIRIMTQEPSTVK